VLGKVPIVVIFDVEPDERELGPAHRPDWLGFERLVDWIRPRRHQIERATGRKVTFNWALRLDEQIAHAYGRADWPFHRYRQLFDELLSEGDGFGIHPHAWRWDDPAGRWLEDHGTAGWPEHCTRLAHATFLEAFGWPPEFFRHGDRFLSQSLIQTLDALAIPFDLTMEPGQPSVERLALHERATGSIPSYASTPTYPFRPSKTDFRRAGTPSHNVWSLPLATSSLLESSPDESSPIGSTASRPVLTAVLGFPAEQVIPICHAALTRDDPFLVTVARTDVLLNPNWAAQFEAAFACLELHVVRGAGRFCSPRQALTWLESGLAHSVRREQAQTPCRRSA
jgi:hypothetical protein